MKKNEIPDPVNSSRVTLYLRSHNGPTWAPKKSGRCSQRRRSQRNGTYRCFEVIEEAGIPIDYVVGTSMGSIIGGLYSIGYTPEQMDSMVRRQDWSFLLSDKIPRSEQNMAEREASEKYVFPCHSVKMPKRKP